ncbi:Putative protein [Zobellia galactanivorans]|uniref:Uncharacterized protein n=1 Tax=Zobellia galactanivorans (strain DSM 12802 / CCUG 47099 / CIP 106680 / NCIMB 13871 / Dsij) TaxID=63186 RepID=G0L1P6_ZOBGA|nr:Putative protein [Zobellia galactanivorans]
MGYQSKETSSLVGEFMILDLKNDLLFFSVL